MSADVTLYRPTEYDEKLGRTHIHREGTLLSTKPKPTDWDGGSVIYEPDTGKVFVYDAENKVWREQ